MLGKKEQFVLLELLVHNELTKKDLLDKLLFNRRCFCTERDFWAVIKPLKEFGLVVNNTTRKNTREKIFRLTYWGTLRAKLISQDLNNPKPYNKMTNPNVYLFEI